MPCTAKKFEANRMEMEESGISDIDAVLTTRELAHLIRMFNLDLLRLQPEHADSPFGDRSSAGKLFGAGGGVMEAALRTAHFLITGRELQDLEVKQARGVQGIKETVITIDGLTLRVAAVSGLGNARVILDEMKSGKRKLDFLEVMSCPGGCIGGGGQPINSDLQALQARLKVLYQIDKNETLRTAHQNPAIKRIYKDFLGEPLSEKSHHLLHTTYLKREIM
jgi:NADP-reducing hydrogenase subunit HndD